MSDSETEAAEDFTTPSGVRRRPRNEDKWKRNIAKKRRNHGIEYISINSGKMIRGRQVGPRCSCAKKCFDLVGEVNIQQLFTEYWASGDWDIQTAYLQKQTTKVPVKRRRTNNEENMHICVRLYHVIVEDTPITVCKDAFASIHGISKSRIDRSLTKVTASNVPVKDQRGKNGDHHKVSEEVAKTVIEHIKSFPTITSHYSRKTCPSVVYLDTDILSRRQMYELYITWLKEKYPEIVACTFHYYDDIFKMKFSNVKLYKPRKDTCKTCDTYAVRCKDPSLSTDDKRDNEIRHSHHLAKAETGYRLPKTLQTSVTESTMFLCMDLQQALPTPKVTTGIAFYKRKMWTYNFNIHDYITGRGHMFVWDEVTAKRGAIEICSCISKFFETYVPNEVRKIIIFSDNCSGQNKNFTLLMFYLTYIHRGRFSDITQVYFQPGHTYMAADSDFGIIEKKMRCHNYIFTPDEHIEIIKKSRKSGESKVPFQVIKMNQEDFRDWDVLKRHVTHRTPSKMRFKDSCFFNISENYMIGYGCGTSYHFITEDRNEEQVRVVKKKGEVEDSLFNLSAVVVPLKYTALIPLPKPKVDDLKDLVADLVPAYIQRAYWDAILGIQPTPEGGTLNGDDPEALVDDPCSSHGYYDYTY
ncbi:hypothetical protein Pmani_019377 [Petrolisthes manimaculis]|uniref:DUF7869 domain-containing protein n=1 Tax=Petrolisthes manimaculis TaxID=1843537 RepID=A0AAE1U410_9EUCA|nr:hypothetical protein Pmani_019377 [Petrolisthes manimaculis]